MRLITAAVLLLTCTLAHSAALNVTIWKPLPGKSAQMMEQAMAAKAIQEKLGATVTIGMENTGRMHYAMAFDNWSDYAQYITKLQANKDWVAWQAKSGANPGSEQEENYLLNVIPGSVDDGDVYQVFIWDPRNGRAGDVVATAMEAKAIHEKSGVRVAINVDQLQRIHYVMNYDDLAHWAKVQDTPNPDFQTFMEKQSENPNADLVEVYTASRVP